jgi:hypothetical protein
VLLGATSLGIWLGRRVQHLSHHLKEPFGILQGALLGLMGLLLAFGLSLAVSRYESRRANVVSEANTIGTTYLRAQTLPEPMRSRSLDLLVRYTRTAISLSDHVPGSDAAKAARASEAPIERQLWALAGQALDAKPTASAPRLYVESLNEMIDGETTRVAALSNRVPTAVLLLELIGASVALGLLGAHLAIGGRGVFGVLLASGLIAFLLLVTADLDRPTRGMIRVPDSVLTDQLESMMQPPAATAADSPP